MRATRTHLHESFFVLVLVLVVVVGAAGCGGAAPAGPDPVPGGGGNAPTITITSRGVSTKSLTVSPGTQVTFVNNDVIIHEMYSDPHPEHNQCPEINQVGALAPGQSRQTGNLNTVRSCGYHDHSQAQNVSLQGSITIR